MAETNRELLATLAIQFRMEHNLRRDLSVEELCARDPQLQTTWDLVLARMRPDLTPDERAELENLRAALAQSRSEK